MEREQCFYNSLSHAVWSKKVGRTTIFYTIKNNSKSRKMKITVQRLYFQEFVVF